MINRPIASYGGQALIEGVMIRGTRAMALAVRRPDGQIVTRADVTETPLATSLRKVPLVRGIVTLIETISLGIKSLYWSARVSEGREDDSFTRAEKIAAGATLIAASAVFIAGPVLLTGWIEGATGHGLAEVVAEGLLRIAILLGYIWFIGRLPEVRRVFSYHAAEHRAIHAYEHGQTLTVENLRNYSNAHPRCGTAFLLTVGVFSLVVFATLGTPPLAERILERIILTPIIAAVAYEFLRGSQSLESHRFMRALQFPNLWLQRLTTREPEDDQIEVAIAAMKTVLAMEAALPEPGATLVPVQVPFDDA